ncbi:hypothetical protein [Microbacterium testaceum]|uniref:Uncharacterized protein n=1 Tax=Microbacterium testaceum TaxID=2033 RepID=A0A2T7WPR7_MICTE|nr:hypothetical protein [Microbacterium testaceum]PVE76099.1 hypothetical protein DC432_06600 [Microbacterium testaceum]
MPHTITANNGTGTTTPAAIEGYNPSRESRNIIYDLLDGSIAVVYVAPRPRSGTLKMLYRNQADAFAAYNLHASPTAFTLSSTDLPAIGMSYVLDGALDIDVDAEMGLWWVSVGFQEV